MGQIDTSEAFLRAFEASDCEQLIEHVRNWFETPYRTPDNSIDVAQCFHTAMTAALTAREEECRRHWRLAEADRWRQARQRFDAGMRGFLEGVGGAAKPEPYRGEADDQEARATAQPAIGRGWHVPQVASRPRGRPRSAPQSSQRNAWGPQPQHA
jgi:hypothetical protein